MFNYPLFIVTDISTDTALNSCQRTGAKQNL